MSSFPMSNFRPGQDAATPFDRILIVDDELRMRTSLRRLLEASGREILECSCGTEALGVLDKKDIAIALLDINLPDISGLDILKWISNNQVPTSVIMVSGDDSIDSAIQALRYGAVEFVRKPGDMNHIKLKVDNALHRRHLEYRHAAMMARLEQSERLHRFLVENSPDLIYTLDDEGRFLFVNNRFESLLGYSRDEVIGKHYSTVVYDEDWELVRYIFNERRSDNRAAANVEVKLKSKNAKGHRQYESRCVVAMLSAVGIYSDTAAGNNGQVGSFMGTYGVARDITERKVAEETISFQAFHDHLTQLPNRRLFKDRLELAITQARRHASMVGVMFVDLDRFKLVNDTYGHAEGDELLKSVAQALRRCVRAGDTLARQGGDEFTILLPDLLQAEDAAVIAEKIVDELNSPFHVAGQNFRATASVGVAVFPRDGDNAETLLKNSDIAMYKVKASGRNAYQFFTSEMNASYHERISLENDLRQAIQRSEFELYFQPQFSVVRKRIVGMEALVRWQHPAYGLLDPAGFIDLAEETGLIQSITDTVLAQACAQLALWRASGHAELRMSVNVSPQEFDRSDLVDRITYHVESNHLPADALEIEITENLLLQDVSAVIEKMRMLRDRGVRISIDDFGTGYSSLNYLRRFPINSIKLDQSFVRDLHEGHRASPIVNAIVGIADGFDLKLLAEGVETDFQRRTLQDLGCDEMQGFLFSAPVPASEAARLLSA
ncbi:MAG TPA: EAL domain-containing protein [Rhodocyclaceae bacterium]|nr:EAL domain-containing protein [Rhodocyclaceae bacterium]